MLNNLIQFLKGAVKKGIRQLGAILPYRYIDVPTRYQNELVLRTN